MIARVNRDVSELWGYARREPKFVHVTTGGFGQSVTSRIQLRSNPRTQLQAGPGGWQCIAWSKANEQAEAAE